MQTLEVTLPGRSYNILMGSGILARSGDAISAVTKAARLAIVTDDNVEPLYHDALQRCLIRAGFSVCTVTVPAGERSKSLSMLGTLYERFAENGLTRGDGVVALGGGVVGDLAGFAAATMFRGIDFIQIPTTLLAQVDSSIGGKTAIDLPQGKNLVGAFYQPKLVIADCNCFSTLPRRVLCDGMAEVIKYGMIADAKLFALLEAIPSVDELPRHWDEIISACCRIKRDVVAEDEFDTGRRAILNFGHTLGHAYELAYNYETYTHGEAVAAGMMKILDLTQKRGGNVSSLKSRLQALLTKFELPVRINCSFDDYAAAVKLDKKAAGRKINIVEVEELGNAKITPMDVSSLMALLKEETA